MNRKTHWLLGVMFLTAFGLIFHWGSIGKQVVALLTFGPRMGLELFCYVEERVVGAWVKAHKDNSKKIMRKPWARSLEEPMKVVIKSKVAVPSPMTVEIKKEEPASKEPIFTSHNLCSATVSTPIYNIYGNQRAGVQ